MKTVYCKTLALLILTVSISCAQTPAKENYFGIRAGYLKSLTDVNNITKLPYEIRLGGIAPLNSFYGGVFYHHNVAPWLAYRVELNYQQKGIELQDQNGSVVGHQRLHYAGVTPLIGITPLNGLNLFVGPEANGYLGQSVERANYGSNTTPIELGISSRLSYRYKWIGLELGYSQALNDYKSVDVGGAQSNLRNRTWQVGLLLVPTMLKTQNK